MSELLSYCTVTAHCGRTADGSGFRGAALPFHNHLFDRGVSGLGGVGGHRGGSVEFSGDKVVA